MHSCFDEDSVFFLKYRCFRASCSPNIGSSLCDYFIFLLKFLAISQTLCQTKVIIILRKSLNKIKYPPEIVGEEWRTIAVSVWFAGRDWIKAACTLIPNYCRQLVLYFKIFYWTYKHIDIKPEFILDFFFLLY